MRRMNAYLNYQLVKLFVINVTTIYFIYVPHLIVYIHLILSITCKIKCNAFDLSIQPTMYDGFEYQIK